MLDEAEFEVSVQSQKQLQKPGQYFLFVVE